MPESDFAEEHSADGPTDQGLRFPQLKVVSDGGSYAVYLSWFLEV
jgi:hypothetical protein